MTNCRLNLVGCMAFAADIRKAIASGRLTPPSLARGLAFSLFFLSAALLAQPSAAAPGQWEFTGSLNTGRVFHTATLLPNEKVLVAGGSDGSVELATAELYDPAIGTWSTTGSMNVARQWHSATLLPNGLVLVAGGLSADEKPSAELYDPGSGTWSLSR
jgi:hypothetical protein